MGSWGSGDTEGQGGGAPQATRVRQLEPEFGAVSPEFGTVSPSGLPDRERRGGGGGVSHTPSIREDDPTEGRDFVLTEGRDLGTTRDPVGPRRDPATDPDPNEAQARSGLAPLNLCTVSAGRSCAGVGGRPAGVARLALHPTPRAPAAGAERVAIRGAAGSSGVAECAMGGAAEEGVEEGSWDPGGLTRDPFSLRRDLLTAAAHTRGGVMDLHRAAELMEAAANAIQQQAPEDPYPFPTPSPSHIPLPHSSSISQSRPYPTPIPSLSHPYPIALRSHSHLPIPSLSHPNPIPIPIPTIPIPIPIPHPSCGRCLSPQSKED